MEIKKIEFQNIFSFGNKKVVVDYDNLGDGSLNMILGKNGCGKSSFIKLHKLALYFESDGVTADGIANDINGNGFLAIDVCSRGFSWRIESEYNRTKLSCLRVYKNGEEQDWGKIPDTKKMIKSEIIDIPYHIFSNIISLSVNNFRSFLSMTPKDTRNIRDRIFGFYALNDMMESVKLNTKSYSEKHKVLQSNLQTIEELRSDLSAKIEELEKSDDREKKSELERLVSERKSDINNLSLCISNLQEKHRKHVSYVNHIHDAELKEAISGLQEKISEATMDMEKYSGEYSDLSSSINEISHKLLLHSKYREYIKKISMMKEIDDTRTEIQNLESSRDEIHRDIEELKSSIDEMDRKSKLKTYLEKRDVIDRQLEKYRDEEKRLVSEIQNLESMIQDMKSKIQELSSVKMDLSSRLLILEKWKSTYESGKCDQCGSDFDSMDKTKILEFQHGIDEILVNIKKIDGDIQEFSSYIESYDENMKKMNNRIATIRIDSETLNREVSTINDIIHQSGYSDSDILQSVIDDSLIPKYDSLISEYSSISKSISDKMSKVDYMINSIKNIDDVFEEIPTESEDELLFEKSSIEKNKEAIYDLIRKCESSISSMKHTIREREMEIIGGSECVSVDDYLDNEDLESVLSSISEKQILIESIAQEIRDLESEISKMEISEISKMEHFQQMMSEYESKIENLHVTIKKCYDYVRFYSLVEHVISDDGVKSYIMKNVVPFINKSVNNILSNLEIPLTVKFDDEFKPSIYRFGKVVSINSISTGQTKMIDSAIIFTITKFLLSRHGDLNIVFYDEIFSSLHQSSISMMMEIIHRELVQDMGLHVFLVNHSPVSSSFFNNIFELSIIDHFSRLEMMSADEYNRRS